MLLLSIFFMQVSTIKRQSSNYPILLEDIPSPPAQLFLHGQLPPQAVMVAIVGSRKCSDYGQAATYQLAYELARAGVVIVSGLALGVDTVAHTAALEAGGTTLAVQACGWDQIYPAANRGLAEQILRQGGGIISEYEKGMPALKQNFPARNRIIAGLCVATIVTEAAARSGALITANFALQQNRQVMAVPGNITNPLSAGPNNLLKAGATPITGSSDVLAALNFQIEQTQPTAPSSQEEAAILELLKQGCRTTQALIERSGLSAQQFASIISLMEITGQVRNLGAGNWVPR